MGASSSKDSSVWGDSSIVETRQGRLRGRRLLNADGDGRSVDAFQGIPFAKPPVGPLRFKKPEPHEPWSGIRDAKSWGNRSIQKEFIIKMKEQGTPSEDCLYLNVFTPTWKPAKEFPSGFPVMVYIHGGGFSMDGAITYGDVGICRNLVTKDVIVVTIHYRLGYLGFWHSESDLIPCNLGLWDQTMALRWVQDNIGAFGGDKNNVTLFGQSAGGASTDMLALSPHSNGLFHKSIPMAGNACADWAFNTESMAAACERKARKMGLSWETHDELAEKLLQPKSKTFEFGWFKASKELDSSLECAPVEAGDFFPEPIDELRRKAPVKPLMTGVTKLEALLFTILKKPTDKAVVKALRKSVPDAHKDHASVREKLHKSYMPDEHRRKKKKVQRGQLELFSDTFLNAPTLQLAQDTLRANEGNAPVFLYVWEYCNPKSWGFMRKFMTFKEASHCTELAYLFGKGVVFPFAFNDSDNAMLATFSRAFTNFAKYGDPNGPPSAPTQLPVKWEHLSGTSCERHMIFDVAPRMGDSFFDGRPSAILAHRREAKDGNNNI